MLAFSPATHVRSRPRIRAPCLGVAASRHGAATKVRQARRRASIFLRTTMPEVIFTGAAGRLEGRYHPAKQKNAPIAMVLHPHPQFQGNMNHPIVYQV